MPGGGTTPGGGDRTGTLQQCRTRHKSDSFPERRLLLTRQAVPASNANWVNFSAWTGFGQRLAHGLRPLGQTSLCSSRRQLAISSQGEKVPNRQTLWAFSRYRPYFMHNCRQVRRADVSMISISGSLFRPVSLLRRQGLFAWNLASPNPRA